MNNSKRTSVLLLLLIVVAAISISSLGSAAGGTLAPDASFTTPAPTTSFSTTVTSSTTTSTTSTTSSTSISISTTTTTLTSTTTSLSSSYTSSTSITTTSTSTSTSYTNTVTTGTTSTTVTLEPVSLTSSTTVTRTSTTTTFALPGCPVAFAVGGTVLAPYANELRVFRNSQIMKTQSGRDFMLIFNAWYYSWAPSVAQYAAVNGDFTNALRITIVPLLGIMYASYFAFDAVSFVNPEIAAVTSGIVAASLIGLVYVAPVAYVSLRLLRLQKRLSKLRNVNSKTLLAWLGGNLLLLTVSFLSGSAAMIGFATVSTLLASLSFGAVTGARSIAKIQLPISNVAASVVAFKHLGREQQYL